MFAHRLQTVPLLSHLSGLRGRSVHALRNRLIAILCTLPLGRNPGGLCPAGLLSTGLCAVRQSPNNSVLRNGVLPTAGLKRSLEDSWANCRCALGCSRVCATLIRLTLNRVGRLLDGSVE